MPTDNSILNQFCEKYGLDNPEKIEKLYEVEELILYLPPEPKPNEKEALQNLIGIEGVSGYMDYVRSGNTFELIMQWREATGNF
jgi:hypothetical protein